MNFKKTLRKYSRSLPGIAIGSFTLILALICAILKLQDPSIKAGKVFFILLAGFIIGLVVIVLRHKISTRRKIWIGSMTAFTMIVAIFFDPWQKSSTEYDKKDMPTETVKRQNDKTDSLIVPVVYKEESKESEENKPISPEFINFRRGWFDFKKDSIYTYVRGKHVGIKFTPEKKDDCKAILDFRRVGFPEIGWIITFDSSGKSSFSEENDDRSYGVLFSIRFSHDARMYVDIFVP